ncbi:MAG: T9SS type A sorting domain-containing protein [Flavobacteriales bacterium]|nr:T9SS type A sorting domain-containing protein [Flavobacteriales bacterium]
MEWKGIHKLLLITLASVLSMHLHAQNLVPNPSFEDYTECPENTGQIINALPWYSVRSSCDYYHECGSNGASIPINYGGGGYARTGKAYAGLKVWCVNDISGINREVLGVPLIETLVEGEVYRVEFYLSMSDSMWYASKDVGAYFSVQQPDSDNDSIESCQPQVRYDGDFITDREGWTRVSGSFVAAGGERFLSIGNFDKYEDTETLFVPGGGVNPWHSNIYWSCSEYFIDDVSVVPDSITGINDELEIKNDELSVYPNPNTGAFTVELKLQEGEAAQLQLWNLAGQQVLAQQLGNGINAIEIDAPQGLYLYNITVNGTPKWTGKLSISS